MNIYDFDKTVYNGDSTVDFFKFILKKHPSVLACVPKIFFAAVGYKLGKYSTKRFKEVFFSFLPKLKDIPSDVDEFWERNEKKIKKWYTDIKRADDLVISASPCFLLLPICKALKVSLIATEMDINTGKIIGENCKGEEKVRRLREKYGDIEIDRFYSDSLSDLPLAEISRRAYLVNGSEISEWKLNDLRSNGDKK